MKTLIKQKVNAEESGQATFVRLTRSTGMKMEKVDPTGKKPNVNSMAVSPEPEGKTRSSIQRPHPSTANPVYANAISIQSGDLSDEYTNSTDVSYSTPPKRPANSVLRNTLSDSSKGELTRTKSRPGRKPSKDLGRLSREEQDKLECRREKNKEAAQRCRARRLGKIKTLEEQVKQLNGEINLLRSTHDKYKSIPKQLQCYLNSTSHFCRLAATPPTTTIPTMAMEMGTFTPGQMDDYRQNKDISMADGAPSDKLVGTSVPLKSANPASSPLAGPKRPTFLNKPINNLISEQKRPASQPSPCVTLYQGVLANNAGWNTGTPGQPDFLASPAGGNGVGWPSGATPQLPSFGLNSEGLPFLDDKTPSRDVSSLYYALDLPNNSSLILETPNTEGPRLTAL